MEFGRPQQEQPQLIFSGLAFPDILEQFRYTGPSTTLLRVPKGYPLSFDVLPNRPYNGSTESFLLGGASTSKRRACLARFTMCGDNRTGLDFE